MNDTLLYGGREQRLAAFEPDVLAELKQKGEQLGRPSYVDDVLDEGITHKWLAERTGQSIETIRNNASGIIQNYFGEPLEPRKAYDRIVEMEQMARIGVSDALTPSNATLAPAPLPATDTQADGEKVDYGDFQALRAATAGFQESALMIPYGTFAFLDGVKKRVMGDGEDAPVLTTPENDRYLANLAKDAVEAARRRDEIRRNSGIDPGYDEEGRAAIEKYQRNIAAVDAENQAKVKAWADKQGEAPFRKLADFWLELAQETDKRLGVDPAFAESSFGQFAKMVGSLPATGALAAAGPAGATAMTAMMYGGEELERRQVEGALFNPAEAVTSLTISSAVQSKIETLVPWDNVFKGAFGQVSRGGKATMKDFAKQVAIVGAGEGLEEPAQGFVSDAVAALSYDTDRNPLTLDALQQRVWEAAAGIAGGVLMGGTFGAAGMIDQNRRAQRAGEYLANKMGGPLNAYDFRAARAAFSDDQIKAMADGTLLLKAVNGDEQAQKEYNAKHTQGKFTSLYGTRVGDSQFGYVLTQTRQMPAILQDNGTITLVDPTDKKAVETWGQALQLHKAKKELLEQEAVGDLINYVRELASSRPNTAGVEVRTPQEMGFAPTLAEQAGNDPVRAQEIYNRYVEIGLLPAGLDPMSPDLRTLGSSQTIYDEATKQFSTVIKIYRGADPLVVIEENAEDAIKRELATGRVTTARVSFWRQAVEGESAAAFNSKEAAIEWVSKYTVAYAVGKAQGNEAKMPKSFREFVQNVAYGIRRALQLASRILELERDNKLPADFQAFMRGAIGMAEQAPAAQAQPAASAAPAAEPDVVVTPTPSGTTPSTADRIPEAEAGSGVPGYSTIEELQDPAASGDEALVEPLPELPPELQAFDEEMDQMYGDSFTEMPIISQEEDRFVVRHPNGERIDETSYATYEQAKTAAANYFAAMERAALGQQVAVESFTTEREELMGAVRRIGFLPTPSSEPVFGGELRTIWNNMSFRERMQTFRRGAMELDALRQELNSSNYGFNFDTITDMLGALADSSNGIPQYPAYNRTEELPYGDRVISEESYSIAQSYVNQNNTPESEKPKAINDIAGLLDTVANESLDQTTYAVAQAPVSDVAGAEATKAALREPNKPELLKAAFAQGNRLHGVFANLVKQPSASFDIRGAIIESPRDLLAFTNAMRSPYVETAKFLFLNEDNEVVYSQIASIGKINATMMSEDIIRRMVYSAPKLPEGEGYRVILSHNHPSGHVKASDADNETTRRLSKVLTLLGHTLLDHLVTNNNTYFSYRENHQVMLDPVTKVTTVKPAEMGADLGATAPVEWDLISRPAPFILTLNTLDSILDAARAVSEDAGHLIYADNQNGVVAIERVPDWKNATPVSLIRQIAETATTQGATAIVVALPKGADLNAARKARLGLYNAMESLGIRMLDISYEADGMSRSMASAGLMEPKAEYAPTTFNVSLEPGFHSRLRDLVATKVQGKTATIEQLRALINNPQSGIKAEEIKWSGINTMLDTMAEVSNKVDRQSVLNYLDNQIGSKFIQYDSGVEDRASKVAKLFGYEPIYDPYARTAYQDKKTGAVLERSELPENVQQAIRWQTGSSEPLIPAYEEYKLPGGENYREVVLAMPSKSVSAYDVWLEEQTPFKAIADEKGAVTDLSEAFFDQLPDSYRKKYEYKAETINRKGGKSEYTSSHFEQVPNYVAHMRLTERPDTAGASGLFIEEIQSDRHQQGREQGYKGESVLTPDEMKRYQELILAGAPRGERTAEDQSIIDRGNKVTSGQGIADAPFRKDWGVQMFKRALRDAVATGKTWIGWTTGETQAKRFQLSNQVRRIDWDPAGSNKIVSIMPVGDGNTIEFAVTQEGKVAAISGQSSGTGYEGRDINEVVGTGIGNRIMAEKSGSASGDGLNIGGEGMKGFYDDILPKEIGKYVKQWGAKVDKSAIPTQPNLSDYYVEEGEPGTFWIMDSETRMEAAGFNGPFASMVEATNYILKPRENAPKTQIWRVDITQQMKEGVALKGQPTFSLANIKAKTVEMPDGAMLIGPDTFSVRAYHGTPHKVDQFRTERIGTGEGAQAYGWGLYFAEAVSVAAEYRRRLSAAMAPSMDVLKEYFKPGRLVSSYGGGMDEVLSFNEGENGNWSVTVVAMQKDGDTWKRSQYERPREHRTYPSAKDLELADIKVMPGNLYTVDLLPDAPDFLDWDEPISKQSDKVKQALQKLHDQASAAYKENPDDARAAELVAATRIILDGGKEQGQWAYRKLSSALGANRQAASEALAKAGIPGIRYLDQQSRGRVSVTYNYDRRNYVVTGMGRTQTFSAADNKEAAYQEALAAAEKLRAQATRNYVIFDEKLIKILEENGRQVQAPALRPGTTFSISTPDPLFSTRDLKNLRREKDAWQAAGSTPAGAMQLVSMFYDRQNYVGISPEATLVPMPSTTGKNILPAALAQRISQDFGNSVVLEAAGINMADRESKTKLSFFSKLADPVAFRPVASVINKLIGVPVYIVEDVHNTGESWIGFAKMLQEWGVTVRGVITLGSADQRMTSSRDIERLSEKVASILQIGVDAVRPHLDDLFNGSYRKLYDLAAREIALKPTLAGRLLSSAVAGGSRGSFRNPLAGQRRSTRRVQQAPARAAEDPETTFNLGATTSVEVIRGRAFSPVVRDLLQRRQNGEQISRAAIDAAIREHFPAQPAPIPTPETLPTKAQILGAIKSNQIKNSIDVSQIAPGTRVQLRQDVDSWSFHGVGVVVVHTENGNGYEASAAIDNVVFGLNEKVSLRIALGGAKTPVVKAFGTWSADQSMPADLANWTQVGYNPDRHSFYYDRKTMQQVTGADRAFQVGNTVFVKGAKFGDGYVSDITYAVRFKPGMISKVSSENDASRVGTSKKGTEKVPAPTTQDDNISGAIITDERLAEHVESLSSYQFIPKSVLVAKTPQAKAKAFIRFFADNLIALHNAFPEEYRARATLWYDGAHRLARELSATHGVTVEQAAAVLASFSPQKDWFMNVAQAEQFISIWTNSLDVKLTQSVVGGAMQEIIDAVTVPDALKVKKQKGESKRQEAIRRAKNLRTLRKLQNERRNKLLPMLNKTIRTLDGEDQAWAIRTYAQAKFGRSYRNISPEGDHLGLAMLDSDPTKPAKNGWGSCIEIEKAVAIMKDGSLLNISKQLGNEHKVRSFYNNIAAPNSPYGDATIDTHAVAAAWIMPYGSSALAVKHNFGGASSSEKLGISGTYWAYLDAYRLAAKELGLQPRQMQSITWEAIRLIYPSEQRNKESIDATAKVWSNSINENQARSGLIPGRVPDPVWAGGPEVAGYPGATAAEQQAGILPDAGRDLPRRGGRSAGAGRGRSARVPAGAKGVLRQAKAGEETFAARLQRQQQSVADIDAEIRANLAVLQQHGTLYTQTQGLAALAQMQNEGYQDAIASAAQTNKMLRRTGSATAKIALPVDFRIERIIPELGRLLRQRTQQAGVRANDDNRKVVAFFEKLMSNGITNGMLAQLDHALFNGHDDVINNIVRQYNAQAELAEVRAVFEQQMTEAIELGVPYRRFLVGTLPQAAQDQLDQAIEQARSLPAGQAGRTIVALAEQAGLVRGIESYWPRKVMNRDALLQTLGLPGVQDQYEKLLDRATATAAAAGRNLTEQELDALIDQANSNARRAQIIAGSKTPGSLKARVIETVTVEQMQYYYKGIDSAMRHNVQMRDHLETLRFFGRSVVYSPSDIDFQVLPVDMSASVGAWITEYQLAGNLSRQQRAELLDMLVARFNYQASPAFIGGLRSFSYLQNMTQITTWLTAVIADSWTGFYDSGSSPYRYGKNFVKAMADLSEISTVDVGLNTDDLGAEFDKLQGLNPTLAESMRGLFSNLLTEQGRDNWTPGQAFARLFDWFSKKIGLPYFERVTREAHINSAVDRLISHARKGTMPRKLQIKLERYFGQAGAARVIADLQAGRRNEDDIRFFAFCVLCDWKVVSLDQMPQGYLASPKGRVFYMYKTWIAAQFAGVYRAAGQDIASGNPAQVASGVTTMLYLVLLMMAVGIPVDAIVSLLQGRPFILQDSAVNRILGFVGTGRYVATLITRGEYGKALTEFFAPPMGGAITDLRDDIDALWTLGGDVPISKLKIWRNLPIFGRTYNGYLGNKAEENIQAREMAGGQFALTDGEQPTRTEEQKAEVKKQRLAKEYGVGSN